MRGEVQISSASLCFQFLSGESIMPHSTRPALIPVHTKTNEVNTYSDIDNFLFMFSGETDNF
jgi:hypothetical protein